MILPLKQQADNRDTKARKAYNGFRVNHLSIDYHQYPEVGLFPCPVQKLLGRKSILLQTDLQTDLQKERVRRCLIQT